ncbi:MAG: HprK-related kinase A [Magnetococcales bacterium]|nr:HprK-related kinase A [Magnetococcales bacterium]
MNIGQLSSRELCNQLRSTGLRWVIGPFIVHLRSRVPDFFRHLQIFYHENEILEPPWDDIADFHATLHPSFGLRRYWRPKVNFRLDGNSFFTPFPLSHAPPMFEWGMNMAVASRSNHYLLLHAAVLEKGGGALVLPGTPGSGKSTLSAALSLRGFRLLSDEFGLYCPQKKVFMANARPVGLKNESIDVIRAFDPRAVLSEEYPHTRKGTVSFLRVPAGSEQRIDLGVVPRWIVFPTFEQQSATYLEKIPAGEGFLRLAANAFNYETLGQSGFGGIAEMVRDAQMMQLRFGRLDEAVAELQNLTLAIP